MWYHFGDQSMDIWSVAAAFPFLLLTESSILWGIKDQALVSFGKMSNLTTLQCFSQVFLLHDL